jgi:hypothetical protein
MIIRLRSCLSSHPFDNRGGRRRLKKIYYFESETEMSGRPGRRKSGKRNATSEAAANAAAESDIMGTPEIEVEDTAELGAEDVGSAAQAAQARAKTTQERERFEELSRKFKALEEENAALKKVMRCSLLVWDISYFLHTICMTASR